MTWQRECLFGNVADGVMRLNEFGLIVKAEWERSMEISHEVELGPFVVMPNHFHGIVILINERAGETDRSPLPVLPPRGPTPKSLGALMAGFKSSVTKQINLARGTPGLPVWQRNYHDHIIRNDCEMDRIWRYIESNPLAWAEDNQNPVKV